jgi:RNA polymerase-binding transcription factor DksA
MKKELSKRTQEALMAQQAKGTTAHFVLFDAAAQEVFVAGSFNNWNPGAIPLLNTGHGHWAKDLPLPAGRHEYQFVVDGRWMRDRASREKAAIPFGGINSVIEVAHPPFKPIGVRTATNRVEPKWSWHYRALIKLRDRLLKDRAEQIGEATEPFEPHSMHIADSATDEFDHEMAIGELDAEQNLLYEVEQAIQRILNGNYGKCELTGKSIPAARLRAVPWTPFSKEVEDKLERLRSTASPSHGNTSVEA